MFYQYHKKNMQFEIIFTTSPFFSFEIHFQVIICSTFYTKLLELALNLEITFFNLSTWSEKNKGMGGFPTYLLS